MSDKITMTPQQIAAIFRQARLAAKALDGYPGTAVPKDLDSAYQIQDMGISAWPDRVSGWKVAMVQPVWRENYRAERVAGPVFAKSVWVDGSDVIRLPVIENGYAAVEAEFAIRIAHEIPAALTLTDPLQLLPYLEGVYAAIELAGSPLATLSALGPGAVVSDFGNNSGLVIGPRLDIAILADPEKSSSETVINDKSVGSGSAARVPGGPLSAVLFLVENLRHRGRTLNAGDWVSTGATTGIHPVKSGDCVVASFGGECRIAATVCTATAAA